ncbi:PhoH family protein [Phocicoccus pinnipedialis]|uniref:PhoH-like protein n=1 Tax=Phocicoccus pinnipedialis TaxID=110845 RepID=A0A6V7RES8_9BACL|nr:PhoH family protein [Jeotgalicoccus pinnipedialis]MBP1939268.1 phosphate starvation-inducible PhoH-like protein [Jeotgalicoccus pinnipedialis]CAD2076087.1 PhoH-like protein [Jeotgalicoccus pinnipedialis]
MTNVIHLDNLDEAQELIGANDAHLKALETEFDVSIHTLGNEIRVTGEDNAEVSKVETILENLLKIMHQGNTIGLRDVEAAIQMSRKDTLEYLEDLYKETIAKDFKGKPIRPKTSGQREYVEMINNYDLTFGVGPAGTGKTFLAVVLACQMLKDNKIKRIVLTRPAVEAGENLGFLPGDLKEKVDPYLRPLYDGLHTVLGVETTDRLVERGIIEIAPLAYMRGRTLNDAFVILDEAQNTTSMQMKMFLTRLGFGSKMVVTGDETQIDLPKNTTSGLIESVRMLEGIKGIGVNHFKAEDVVRHPLVTKIIRAYEG